MAPLDFLALHVVESHFQAIPLLSISLVYPSFTLVSLGLDRATKIKSQYLKPNSPWTIIYTLLTLLYEIEQLLL